jgi:cysteinyl-tRNA synthetase
VGPFLLGVGELLKLGRVLGLFEVERAEAEPPAAVRERIEALVRERDEARRRRDYATADALRRALHVLGVRTEDTPEGTRWTWAPDE